MSVKCLTPHAPLLYKKKLGYAWVYLFFFLFLPRLGLRGGVYIAQVDISLQVDYDQEKP